jgi:hypothetical protein
VSGVGVRCHTNCRVCGESLPEPYLDLGEQPLANALVKPWDVHPNHGGAFLEFTAPLAIALCPSCGLSQLTVVVDPRVLYSHYNFQSGVSGAWRAHCFDLAKEVSGPDTSEFGGNPSQGFAIDIAANDGTQLKMLASRGWRCLGVEPSDVPMGDWKGPPIKMVREFWSEQLAHELKAQHGPADLIVAQNVLGHVDDVHGFLCGVRAILADDGRCAIEVPDALEMATHTAFDTIYHEHLSYWIFNAMTAAAGNAGLEIADVDRVEVHGGSRRYWLRHRTRDGPSVPVIEFGLTDFARGAAEDFIYRDFAARVHATLKETASILWTLKTQGKRVWAFGASAKGAVFLNALRRSNPQCPLPEIILDETPEKQGMLSPGTHIPIRGMPESLAHIDVLWLMSWNWAWELKRRARERGFAGQFLVTSPEVRLEDWTSVLK